MAMSPAVKISFWAAFLALFVGFIWLFNAILTPFILGVIIAYLLDPVMRRFSRKRIPRWATSLVILSLFFSFVAIVLAIVAPLLFRQGQELVTNAPAYWQEIVAWAKPYMTWVERRVGRDYVEEINTALKDSAGQIVAAGGGIAASIASGGKFIIELGTTMVVTPLVAFFMMKEWPQITRWVENLYPRQHATLIRRLLGKINVKVAGFIRGQIIIAFMLGVIYAVALSIAGLNYGFLIGIGAGLFSIIPLVGSTLGLVVGIAVAWFQTDDITYCGVIAAIFLVGQFVEGNFLAPKVVGDTVGLHPLWVMFALLAGGSLFGILGMLIAVPIAAVIGVLGDFAIQQYKSSTLYLRDPDATAIILDTTIEPTPPQSSLILPGDAAHG